MEPVDDRTRVLRNGSRSPDHLVVWVAAFGFEFEIQEPPELGAHLRTLTGRLQRVAVYASAALRHCGRHPPVGR
ncbi:hypothetical protein ACFVRD_41695 [Streptomyces sp. NPDC057908]|uniref:hypothetical protein n=1 Tax=Streptomyces sp. NPDC057908 TaxID=3346276 RepID=UPI0036E0CC49